MKKILSLFFYLFVGNACMAFSLDAFTHKDMRIYRPSEYGSDVQVWSAAPEEDDCNEVSYRPGPDLLSLI